MPPVALDSQANGSVIDATTNVPACVQFSASRQIPNQEDCLKLVVWKPASANRSSSLPVLFNIHVSRSGEDSQLGSPTSKADMFIVLYRVVVCKMASRPTTI